MVVYSVGAMTMLVFIINSKSTTHHQIHLLVWFIELREIKAWNASKGKDRGEKNRREGREIRSTETG